MVEAADLSQTFVQRVLARVTERRMAKVVRQRDCLGQILIQPQAARQGAADLGHFERMGEPRAMMVVGLRNDDLRLVHEPTEGRRMDEPLAVALKDRAIRMRGFRIAPPPTDASMHRERGQHGVLALEPVWRIKRQLSHSRIVAVDFNELANHESDTVQNKANGIRKTARDKVAGKCLFSPVFTSFGSSSVRKPSVANGL